MSNKQRKVLIRIIVTTVILIALLLLDINGMVRLLCFVAAYLTIGYDILRKAFRGILRGRVFDENFLMAVATLGAFALAIYEKSGDYFEAVAVMLFYQIGELFQSIASSKSRKSITELMDLRPDHASIEENGETRSIDPAEIKPSDILVVNPGEKIPVDGVVTEGVSFVDTAALTGESVPVEVCEGDEVLSGSVNMSGVIKVRAEKKFGDSAASRILKLLEESGYHKAGPERFISRFARVYTPLVCAAAVIIAFLPPVLGLLFSWEPSWGQWIYRALTFLVISCPCALVISIPLSFFAGIGGLGRDGILVKGSDHIESLSKADTVVFDKTGTLTKGSFEVNGIHHSTIENEKLLEYAALCESASSHPVSISLKKAYGRQIDKKRVRDIKEISGHGVTAEVDGLKVAAGNDKLMEKLGISYTPCSSAGTIIHMAIEGEYAGHILISDSVKPEAKTAVSELEKLGIKRICMLTGDNEKAASHIAEEIGINETYSSLLPENKAEVLETMMEKSHAGKKTLAFAGDGINDAPVLMRSDVGIAMGAIGSDAAIEAADIVLMDDNPLKIPSAIKRSRKCMAIVKQNIIFSLAVKFICLILGAVGIANMWYAVFADVGVMVIAVLNAIRALRR